MADSRHALGRVRNGLRRAYARQFGVEALECRRLLTLTPFGSAIELPGVDDVAIGVDGAFAAAWVAGEVIFLQSFDSDGESEHAPITVGDGDNVDIARSEDGQVVVQWINGSTLNQQRFDSDGTLMSGGFAVPVPEGELHPVNADGSFCVTWEVAREPVCCPLEPASDAYVQKYGANGSPVFSPILLQDYIVGLAEIQVVSLSTGGFVVAWSRVSGSVRDDLYTSVATAYFSASGSRLREMTVASGVLGFSGGEKYELQELHLLFQDYVAISTTQYLDFRGSLPNYNGSRVTLLDSTGDEVTPLIRNQNVAFAAYPGMVMGSGQVFDTLGVEVGTTPNGSLGRAFGSPSSPFVAVSDDDLGSSAPRTIRRFLTYAAPTLFSPKVVGTLAEGETAEVGSLTSLGFQYEIDLMGWDGAAGATHVTNLDHWKLERDGSDISGRIMSVDATHSREFGATIAVATLSEPLLPGTYRLTVRDGVWDRFERALDGDHDGLPGGDFVRIFTIAPRNVRVATPEFLIAEHVGHYDIDADADGNFVSVWNSGTVQEYSYLDQPTRGFQLSRDQEVSQPHVAMNASGQFAISWSEDYEAYLHPRGKFWQRYSSYGIAEDAVVGIADDRGSDTRISLTDAGVVAAVVVGPAWEDNSLRDMDLDAFARSATIQATADFPQYILGVNSPCGGFHHYYMGNASSPIEFWPRVLVQDNGDFSLAWTDAGRLYLQKVNCSGTLLGDAILVAENVDENLFDFGLDGDGGMVLTWSGTAPGSDLTEIFARRYDAEGNATTDAFMLNTITAGRQYSPRIGVGSDGDFVVGWLSETPTGNHLVARRILAGPELQGLFLPGSTDDIAEGEHLRSFTSQMVVGFDEALATDGGATGENSVLNPANWSLARGGVDVSELIDRVAFDFNSELGRFEALVAFTQPLTGGRYKLTLQDDVVGQDFDRIDGDGDGFAGGDFVRSFGITGIGPVGDEFPLNSYTAGDQRIVADALSTVAMRDDGSFVAVWSSMAQDGDAWGVYARRFDAEGTPIDAEFRVNQAMTGNQHKPAIAMDADGDFVVAFASDAAGQYDIYARRFSADGTPNGNEFRINATQDGAQHRPAVAVDPEGDFVVLWESQGQDGFGFGIFGQRFAASGTAVGSEFPVNNHLLSDQVLPRVAMDADGAFVASWSSFGEDGSGYGVYARRFNAAGAPVGNASRVNTYASGEQWFSQIAMEPDGDYAIAWQSDQQDGSGAGIYLQRYNSLGELVGGERKVNSFVIGDQRYPAIAVSENGDLVVTWGSLGQDGSSWGVYAQRFDSSGAAIGNEFRVNSTTANRQTPASVAMAPTGEFVVTWASVAQDGSGYGIFGQRFGEELPRNFPPEADAGGPYEIAEGASLALDASASHDPDGEPLTFSWDLNGDGVFGDVTGVNPTVTWAQLQALGMGDGFAVYDSVRVRAVDLAGNVNESSSASLSIQNVAPTIALAGSESVAEGDAYQLTLDNVVDPGDDTVVEWIVNWGDGHKDVYASGGVKAHVYANGPAQRTITVDLRDEDGLHMNRGSKNVSVANRAPQLSGVTVNNVEENGIATLHGTIVETGSTDSLELTVFWGDGTAPEVIALPAGTVAFEVPHRYLDNPTGSPNGQYPIDLLVRDVDGGQDTESLRVTVRNVAPVSEIDGLQLENPVGQTVTLSASVFDPGTLDLITYAWIVERNGEIYAVSSASTLSFTPNVAGSYLVRLVVRDDDGASTSMSAVVRVPGGPLEGDTNGDGIVDLVDLNNVRNNFGALGAGVLGDANDDGHVDLQDLNAVRNNFGASASGASALRQRVEPAIAESCEQSVLERSRQALDGRRIGGRVDDLVFGVDSGLFERPLSVVDSQLAKVMRRRVIRTT